VVRQGQSIWARSCMELKQIPKCYQAYKVVIACKINVCDIVHHEVRTNEFKVILHLYDNLHAKLDTKLVCLESVRKLVNYFILVHYYHVEVNIMHVHV
jgi:hypothetical protein